MEMSGGRGGYGGGGHAWSAGVLDCFGKCDTCCCGTFCAPCLASQSADRLGASWFLYLALSVLCPCAAMYLLRSKTRAAYNIDGGDCADVACACLCTPCVNCQVANEIQRH